MNGSNDLQGSTHEELCALVLGELDGGTRARVESAIEASPELRAERDRIAATIGLVQEACAGSQSLSAEVLGRLERDAAPRRPWYAQTWLRAAAVFALMAGGVIAVQEKTRMPAPAGSLDELARADAYRPGIDLPVDGSIRIEERALADAREQLKETQELWRSFDKRDALGELAQDSSAPAVGGLADRELGVARQLDEARANGELGIRLGHDPITPVDLEGYGASTGFPGQPSNARVQSENPNVDMRARRENLFRAGLEGKRAKDSQGESPAPADSESLVWRSISANTGEAVPELQEGQALNSVQPRGGPAGAGRTPKTATVDPVIMDELAKLGYVDSTESEVLAGETVLELRKSAPAGAVSGESPTIPNSGLVQTHANNDLAPDASPPEERVASLYRLEADRGEAPASESTVLERARGALDNKKSAPGRAGGGGGGGPITPGPAQRPAPQPEPAPGANRERRADRAGADDFFLGAKVAPAEEPEGEEATGEEPSAGFRYYADDDGDDLSLGRRRQLLSVDVDAIVTQRVDRLLQDCRRRPHERPSAMYFRFWGDNPFVLAQLDPQSTFGVDVDTASYALARRYLTEGYLPEKAQVRTEEFVNYFAPDVDAPTEGTFAVHADLAPSRFGAGAGSTGQRWMLRVVVRGKEVSREERQPLSLAFVIDTSGSMKRENRLELVKHSLRLLVGELDARDSISLVAFSNEARVVLPMTSAANRGVIEAAIFGLNADGGTNAEAGLKLGYELALGSLSQAARSRVVLLSDGVANIGQTDQDRIGQDVRRHREAGIYLNTVGVGLGNHNDVFLEQLADKGDGLCNYVDGPLEARRALVDNFTGAFEPIARDVKVQLEFDPSRVYRYRQLGYENRAIADKDFRNDQVDAGEVGAGHQVTALYELELAAPPTGDDAKLATVRLRWKAPSGAGRDPLEDSATEREYGVAGADATSWEGASAGFKRASIVAQFAEILRRSSHARDDSLDELLAEAAQLDRQLSDPDFHEFVAMVEKSRRLVMEARPRRHDPLERCVDTLRRNRILHAELEELRWERDAQVLQDLELQNRELEARIHQLMRDRVEQELR